MGFNFQAGHASDVLTDGADIAKRLVERFGPSVPLGSPGQLFCLRDEMAWSWWSELQAFAETQLGQEGSRHIRAVDAWYGVYLDADVTRELLRTTAKAAEVHVIGTPLNRLGFFARLRGKLGLGPREESESEIQAASRAAMQSMVDAYGARSGEQGQLQISGLRGLIRELESVLGGIEVEASAAAVEALMQSYAPDDRVDEDGHIQCLCHAWFTANHAVLHQSPLWLIK